MRLGDCAETRLSIGARDLRAYEALFGAAPDNTPEVLVMAGFSTLLGTQLPGAGTHYLKQRFEWHQRPQLFQMLTLRVTVSRLRPDKRLADLVTDCLDTDGRCLGTGRALVKYRAGLAASVADR